MSKENKSLRYVNLAIQNKLIQIRKIRGIEKPEKNVVFRQYIELIVDPRVENKIVLSIQKKYIVSLRNYQKKFFYDNLNTLKYVPLNNNLEFPDGLKVDPFSIKVCKKSGEYGIALSVKCFHNNKYVLENPDAFYDTTEARDLVNAEKFPGKSSILIFGTSLRHTVNEIFADLELIFTPPRVKV